MQKMGGMSGLIDKMPGMGGMADKVKDQVNDREIRRMIAIIQSMTPKERRYPDIIKGSRKRRIAAGCGLQVQDVNRLLKEFRQARTMARQMGGAGGKLPKGIRLPRGRRGR